MRASTCPMTILASVLGLALLGCRGGDAALDDAETLALVEDALADLDLPGEPDPVDQIPEVPEGELAFGFHCQIRSADLEIDDVLVGFPPPQVGHQEHGRVVERVEVAILVFDTVSSASAVLAAYENDDAIACLSATFGETLTVEPDEPLEVDKVTAEGFAVTVETGEIQRDGHRTFAVVLDRVLVDITVLAPDERRGRELATNALDEVLDSLRAGGLESAVDH